MENKMKNSINNISLWEQLGYLFLANSDEFSIKNSFTVSVGFGYIFGLGEH